MTTRKQNIKRNSDAPVHVPDINESALLARKVWSDLLGQTFGGDRDIYKEAGWKRNPTTADYRMRFERQDIAGTLIAAYPDATWREPPAVLEDDTDEDTPFEAAFKEHAELVNLWQHLCRVDIMAGVGQYAVLLLGLDDVKDVAGMAKEAKRAAKVLYLQPFFEEDAEIMSWVENAADPRYGLPLTYRLTSRVGGQTGAATTKQTKLVVHASRVIHVAEGCMSSDVFGTPRLQRVFNRLEDVEKILGASAEGYWKNAFPGRAFVKDADADFGDTEAEMEQEIEEYYHGLTRWMRLSGMKVETLTSELNDPKPSFEIQIAMLSAASRIPQRILLGSERGELASSQDESAWLSRVDERRKRFAWPLLLRPYVQKLIDLGILPKPVKFDCEWEDITALSEQEQAEVAVKKTTALKAYSDAMANGGDLVIPPFYFLTDVMGIDDERAREYEQVAEQRAAEEAADAEAAALVAEEEAARLAAEQAAAGESGPAVDPPHPSPVAKKKLVKKTEGAK